MTSNRIDVGIATRAMPGQDGAPCGDVGFLFLRGEKQLVGLIDGLGHGEPANDIAVRARDAIEQRPVDEPLEQTFVSLARDFRGDRGFVAALCCVDAGSDELAFCGIGNITTRLFAERETTLLSGAGIVGQYSVTPKLKLLDFPVGSFLVLHTDGMSSHLHAEQLLQHRQQPAAEAAKSLLAAYARPNDDCGLVVIRHQ